MTKEEEMFNAVMKRDHVYFKNLPQSVDLNAQNEQGNTLLHKLAKTAFVPHGVENVLKRHPNPFIENQDGMTPRMLAVWAGNEQQAEFLAAYEEAYKERERQFQIKHQAEALSLMASLVVASCTASLKEILVLKVRMDNISKRMSCGSNSRS